MRNYHDFMKWRRLAINYSFISGIFVMIILYFQGFNLGMDFTGGLAIEAHYNRNVSVNEVRDLLVKNKLSNAQVQHFGTSQDILIKLPPKSSILQEQAILNTKLNTNINEKILEILKNPDITIQTSFLGPQIGAELLEQGSLAIFVAIFGIFIYVMLRFEWKLAVGAVIATIHDIIITAGMISIFNIEFNLTTLAAILAVIGYSVNDTVVVLDRIRENFHKVDNNYAILKIINISINETLSRTITTSFVTLLSMIVLFLFGGQVVNNFAITMIIGIIVGTYSSIYIASSVAVYLGLCKENLYPTN